MSKFKVGDKVKLKRTLKEGTEVGDYYVNTDMIRLKDTVLTISKVWQENGKDRYNLEEDVEDTYTNEMFSNIKYNLETEEIKKLEQSLLFDEEQLKEITVLAKEVKELTNQVKKQDPFQKAMTEAIIEKGKEIATKDLEDRIKQNLDKFIEEKYGILPKTIILKSEESEKELKGIFHKQFEKICKRVKKNIPIMLVGPAGAGKNHTLKQVSDALGLDFYSTGSITREYKIEGYEDANGVYHPTEFYKAFKNGGLFFLDEIDASVSEILVILNGAIANGYYDFPNGRIECHPDFRVVCAGNTYGTGADMVYVGRNVLDGATLDRFVKIDFDYDSEVERQLAYDEELLKFIWDVRKAVNDSNLRYIIGMRSLIYATKMLEIGESKKDIIQDAIIKNMQKDDLNTIVKKITVDSEWAKELKGLSDYVRD